MKLKDWINEKTSEGCKVAIGANSSYMYVGCSEKAEAHIIVDNKKYKNEAMNKKATAEKLLPGMEAKAVEKFLKVTELMHEIKRLQKELDSMMEYNETICDKIKGYHEDINYADNYIDMLEREVIRSYAQDASDYADVAILDGPETGKYWTEAEMLEAEGKEAKKTRRGKNKKGA